MGAGASTIDAPNWGFSASELKTVVGKERWDPEEFAKLPKNSDGNITNKTWKRLCEKEEMRVMEEMQAKQRAKQERLRKLKAKANAKRRKRAEDEAAAAAEIARQEAEAQRLRDLEKARKEQEEWERSNPLADLEPKFSFIPDEHEAVAAVAISTPDIVGVTLENIRGWEEQVDAYDEEIELLAQDVINKSRAKKIKSAQIVEAKKNKLVEKRDSLYNRTRECRARLKTIDWLVASSHGNMALVHTLFSGCMKLALRGHTGYIIASSFDSTRSHLVTGSKDGTAILWDVSTTTTDPIKPPTPRRSSNNGKQESFHLGDDPLSDTAGSKKRRGRYDASSSEEEEEEEPESDFSAEDERATDSDEEERKQAEDAADNAAAMAMKEQMEAEEEEEEEFPELLMPGNGREGFVPGRRVECFNESEQKWYGGVILLNRGHGELDIQYRDEIGVWEKNIRRLEGGGQCQHPNCRRVAQWSTGKCRVHQVRQFQYLVSEDELAPEVLELRRKQRETEAEVKRQMEEDRKLELIQKEKMMLLLTNNPDGTGAAALADAGIDSEDSDDEKQAESFPTWMEYDPPLKVGAEVMGNFQGVGAWFRAVVTKRREPPKPKPAKKVVVEEEKEEVPEEVVVEDDEDEDIKGLLAAAMKLPGDGEGVDGNEKKGEIDGETDEKREQAAIVAVEAEEEEEEEKEEEMDGRLQWTYDIKYTRGPPKNKVENKVLRNQLRMCFKIGDNVGSRYFKRKVFPYYREGVVRNIRSDGSYDVKFPTGRVDREVPRRFLRPGYREGMLVEVLFRGRGTTWMAGRITRRRGDGRFDVDLNVEVPMITYPPPKELADWEKELLKPPEPEANVEVELTGNSGFGGHIERRVNVETCRPVAAPRLTLKHGGVVLDVCFHPDPSEHIVATVASSKVTLWHTTNGSREKTIHHPFAGMPPGVTAAYKSRAGETEAKKTNEGDAAAEDDAPAAAADANAPAAAPTAAGDVTDAPPASEQDGDAETKRKPKERLDSNVFCACFSGGSGQVLVTGGKDGKVRIWDWRSRPARVLRVFEGHTGMVYRLAVPKQTVKWTSWEMPMFVASTDSVGALIVWDGLTGKIRKCEGGGVAQFDVRTNKFFNRPALFCTGQAKGVRINDVAAEEIIEKTVDESVDGDAQPGKKKREEEEEESKDEHFWVASGFGAKGFKVFDIASGRAIYTNIKTHTGAVLDCAVADITPLCPQFRLVTASSDSSVKFHAMAGDNRIIAEEEDSDPEVEMPPVF